MEKALKSVEEGASIYRSFLPRGLEGEALIVDDGLATGYTMLAAVKAARKLGAQRATVAVPTCLQASARLVAQRADKLVALNVCTQIPFAVAGAYRI